MPEFNQDPFMSPTDDLSDPDSPPLEEQIISLHLAGWETSRIAHFSKCDEKTVTNTIMKTRRSVKARAIKKTERDLVEELVQLRYLEKRMFSQLANRPQHMPNYMKIKEQIESCEKALNEILDNSSESNQSKPILQQELLKLELQKKRGELVSRQDVDNVLEVILNLLQASLQHLKMEQSTKSCRCFDTLLATVQDISKTVDNMLGGEDEQ